MSQAIYFFATRADIAPVLEGAESNREIKYVLAGMFDNSNIQILESGLEIENLGIATKGDHNHERRYLVVSADAEIVVREVPQRRGGIRYAIDQQMNPASVIFLPGGVFQENCVIHGEISTCKDHPTSKDLFRLFASEVRRQFVKIQEYYVGNEAAELLDRGYRLTQSVQSPVECDLVRMDHIQGETP